MSEPILNALLQLFAIIANVSEDGVSFKARNIVKSYLYQHLNINLIDKYLNLFDDYLQLHQNPEVFFPGTGNKRDTDTDTQKVINIGEAINKVLLQREKFIVFLRLVEFINEDDIMTRRELDFIASVADTFNITASEQNNIKNFVLDPVSTRIDPDKLLIIDNCEGPVISEAKHIFTPELEGRISILWNASTNTFIFRYRGKSAIYLNGYNILPDQIELMEQGAMITGYKISPVFYSDVSRKFHHSEKAPKIRFIAEDLEHQFKNSSKGIKKFSFNKESGNLIGIMGGSGVGKSTLLNILCGKIKPDQGRITINGIDIHKETEKIEGIIGFVPQDDLLIEELTVFENLWFNAKLCLSHFSKTELLRKVNQILIDLELDDAKHLKVGNPLKKFISGGQRKRLNIALELIREPGVLFVDEPTSGLSSMDSEKVMHLLKEQALQGRLVIVNIHQPFSDIYKLFDRVLILDKGGYVIFKGNPIDAIIYFKTLSNYVNAEEGHCISCGNVMPEEILQIVEAREVDEYGKLTKERRVPPEEWYRIYQNNIESKQEIKSEKGELPKIDFKVPSRFNQFLIYMQRNIKSKLVNQQYLLVTFLEAPLLAVVIGYFTKYISETTGVYILKDNVNLPAYIFMAVVVALFMGLMVSAEEIIRDRKILNRESFLHLSRLSYLHSKILVLFLISAIQTFSFVLLGNLILEIKGMTFAYWLILFTTSCLANMIGLNISAGLNSIITIYIVIPFILVPQLLFSGVIVSFDKLHTFFRNPVFVPMIGEMMTSRWAYEALAVHQFKDNKFNRNFFAIEQLRSNAYFQKELVKEIQVRLNNAHYNHQKGTSPGQVKSDLELVRRELRNLARQDQFQSFDGIDLLVPEKFNMDAYQDLLDYLADIRSQSTDKQNEANRLLDEQSSRLVEDLGGKKVYNRLENDHTNDRLNQLVLNSSDVQRIIEKDNRLVRRYQPVYMEPLSNFGRAHFYAPVKKIFNQSFDTFRFNFVMIWISSLAFYLTLVFDILRRVVKWSETVRFRRNQ
ncbi:MAG: ATP-binding cassette domain-containing protein [Bacteroidales bacterium]|nr:ATP-binding cassette domain-containing protein [Bacteroidales bacterium]